MSNFVIKKVFDGIYLIVPITEIAISLSNYCMAHGESWNYHSLESAIEKQWSLDYAIELRNGRPWVVYQ